MSESTSSAPKAPTITRDELRAAQTGQGAKGSKPEPRPPARGPAINIEEGMTGLYETLGLLALMRGDQEAARVIIGDERLAEILASGQEDAVPPGIAKDAGAAWSRLAQKNRNVHNALTKLLEGSMLAEVIQAHAPLIALVMRRKPIKLSNVRKFRLFRRLNFGRQSPNGSQQSPQPNPAAPASA